MSDRHEHAARELFSFAKGEPVVTVGVEASIFNIAAALRAAAEQEREACCQIIEACARSLDHREGETFKNVMWPIEDISKRGSAT